MTSIIHQPDEIFYQKPLPKKKLMIGARFLVEKLFTAILFFFFFEHISYSKTNYTPRTRNIHTEFNSIRVKFIFILKNYNVSSYR